MISLPTGSGKGKLCMMIVDQAPTDRKWLVVVPEVLQIENLCRDIEKHGYKHLYKDKIEAVICYASLPKYFGRKLNLWLNEVHRLSELKSDISESIEADRIIVDSATIPAIIKERLSRLGDFHQFNMTLKEAIEIGLLPEPAIYVHYVQLDDQVKRNEATYGKQAVLLTDRGYSDYLDEQISYWMGEAEEQRYPTWISNKIKQLGSKRKKFLAECKTEAAKALLWQLRAKRLLCYTGSIEQCNELGGNYAVNSKKTKKHNLQALENFNSYLSSKLVVNKMGKEGLNLEGIEAVVMTQLDSGNDEGLSFIQRTGRGLRSDDPEIYLLVCRNTQDEKYLRKALLHVEKRKVKYETF